MKYIEGTPEEIRELINSPLADIVNEKETKLDSHEEDSLLSSSSSPSHFINSTNSELIDKITSMINSYEKRVMYHFIDYKTIEIPEEELQRLFNELKDEIKSLKQGNKSKGCRKEFIEEGLPWVCGHTRLCKDCRNQDKKYISKCCKSSVHKDQSDEGTFTYVCDKCDDDCDIIQDEHELNKVNHR